MCFSRQQQMTEQEHRNLTKKEIPQIRCQPTDGWINHVGWWIMKMRFHDRKETQLAHKMCSAPLTGLACFSRLVYAFVLATKDFHLQFQIHNQLHFQFRFRTPSRPRLLWQQLTVSVSRIVTSGGGSGRLSFWLLSPKNITNCCPLVDFTEPRWAFRDPNKLLIINWGKYAVIVAVASSTSFFLSFWLSGWQWPKIKWN